MSRPLAFWLAPADWTDVWETVDSLRLAAVELDSEDGGRALAAVEACMQELRPLWLAQAEELAASDPRCAYERVALTCDPPDEALAGGARWVATEHGALIVRYADSDLTEEPLWLGDSRQLLRSLLATLKEVVE